MKGGKRQEPRRMKKGPQQAPKKGSIPKRIKKDHVDGERSVRNIALTRRKSRKGTCAQGHSREDRAEREALSIPLLSRHETGVGRSYFI